MLVLYFCCIRYTCIYRQFIFKFHSLTSNHLFLTTVGLNSSIDFQFVLRENYPASLWNCGGLRYVGTHSFLVYYMERLTEYLKSFSSGKAGKSSYDLHSVLETTLITLNLPNLLNGIIHLYEMCRLAWLYTGGKD